MVEFRDNEHCIVVDLLHTVSLPMMSITSHGLTTEIKIYLTAIQLQHILHFITSFPKLVILLTWKVRQFWTCVPVYFCRKWKQTTPEVKIFLIYLRGTNSFSRSWRVKLIILSAEISHIPMVLLKSIEKPKFLRTASNS